MDSVGNIADRWKDYGKPSFRSAKKPRVKDSRKGRGWSAYHAKKKQITKLTPKKVVSSNKPDTPIEKNRTHSISKSDTPKEDELPYFNPHSLRNTLVQLGEKVCKTPEQFKAWSQNLGHEKVLTTFLSYGEVACQRQGEIIRDLTAPASSAPHANTEDLAEAIVRKMNESGLSV